MIDTIGLLMFLAICALVVFLFGLMAVGSFYEIRAEILEARARTASAIEAHRAETGNTDSVHESAVPNGETPNE